MIKAVPVSCILLIIFLLLALTKVVFAEEEMSLTLTTGEYPPDYSENYKHHGLTPHIVTESFALRNVSVKWNFVPWERANHMAQNLYSDATCCWAKTEERQKYFLYSNPVQDRIYVLFHLKNYDFDWQTMDDLQGITISTTIGYAYGKAFDEARKAGKLQVEEAPSDIVNFKKLLSGRIKLLALPVKIGYAIINDTYDTQMAELFTHHPNPFYTYNNHVIISKAHSKADEVLRRFNEGIAELRSTGLYNQFLAEASRGEYLVEK